MKYNVLLTVSACQQAEQTEHVQQVQAYREAAVFVVVFAQFEV
jgi:hypothetical protein